MKIAKVWSEILEIRPSSKITRLQLYQTDAVGEAWIGRE
jgi:hypothetical protein